MLRRLASTLVFVSRIGRLFESWLDECDLDGEVVGLLSPLVPIQGRFALVEVSGRLSHSLDQSYEASEQLSLVVKPAFPRLSI